MMSMLVALTCAAAAPTPAPETDLAIAELSGPVKYVRLEVLKFDKYEGKLDTERMRGLEAWYDRAGNLIEEKYYTPDFVDDRHPQRIDAQTYLLKATMGDKKRHRAFDSDGRLFEEIVYTRSGDGWELLDQTRFRYDSHNRVIESDQIRDGAIDGFILIKRDAVGNVVLQEYHFSGRRAPFPCTWYDTYKIDRHGNWTQRRAYDFDPEEGKPKRTFSGINYQIIEYYPGS